MPRVFGSAVSDGNSRVALAPVWPSPCLDRVGTPEGCFRSSIPRPACTPVNASPAASRPPVHDSGSGWGATPSLCDSFIRDSMPASPALAEAPAEPDRATCSTLTIASGYRVPQIPFSHLRHLRIDSPPNRRASPASEPIAPAREGLPRKDPSADYTDSADWGGRIPRRPKPLRGAEGGRHRGWRTPRCRKERGARAGFAERGQSVMSRSGSPAGYENDCAARQAVALQDREQEQEQEWEAAEQSGRPSPSPEPRRGGPYQPRAKPWDTGAQGRKP